MLLDSYIWECNNQIRMKKVLRSWTGGGGGEGVGDNMHGWATVGHGVDICLSYNTAHSKNKKKKTTTTTTDKQNTGRQRGRAA